MVVAKVVLGSPHHPQRAGKAEESWAVPPGGHDSGKSNMEEASVFSHFDIFLLTNLTSGLSGWRWHCGIRGERGLHARGLLAHGCHHLLVYLYH